MASLLDPRKLPGMLAPDDTLRWYHAAYGGFDDLLGTGLLLGLWAFLVAAAGGSLDDPASVLFLVVAGTVTWLVLRFGSVVEVAVSDRGLHRRTGVLRTRGTGWEFLPVEQVVSVVESERYHSDYRTPDHGVRVTTADGVELFFTVERDLRGYLDAVEDVTDDGVVKYPPRFREGGGGRRAGNRGRPPRQDGGR